MDMNLSKLQETVEDRGVWCALVHKVSKTWTWLSVWIRTWKTKGMRAQLYLKTWLSLQTNVLRFAASTSASSFQSPLSIALTSQFAVQTSRLPSFKNKPGRSSLVAQWIRIHLPMQGTQLRSLVREDSTCCGTSKPVCHNCWVPMLQLLKPTYLEPVVHNKGSHCNQNLTHHNAEQPLLSSTRESCMKATKTERLAQPKIKQVNKQSWD